MGLIADWVEKNQELWNQRDTQKAKALSVFEWLNYMGKLTSQNPRSQYIVIYNARGADAMAHVINRNKLPEFKIDQLSIKPRDFIADTTTFYLWRKNSLYEPG
jgi:hypothetical protein